MTGILLSKGFVAQFGAELQAAAKAAGVNLHIIHLPDDASQRLSAADIAKIEVAYLTRDIRFSDLYASFGDTVKTAANLKWVHFTSTGIDQHPFMPALAERKVRLTTSAGTNGEPVGQTAFCGLLMLARGFPRWLAAQRERRWDPVRRHVLPAGAGGDAFIGQAGGFVVNETAEDALPLFHADLSFWSGFFVQPCSLCIFLPPANNCRLSTNTLAARLSLPSEAEALCGDTITFGMSHSGESAGSGSFSNTSR